jgi:hypothetical protein
MSYPWYEILTTSDEIRQGDFIPNCPILIPPANLNLTGEGEVQDVEDDITVKALDAIVISQSCDLENNKLEIVLVCPLLPIEEFFQALPTSDQMGRGREKKIEALKQGHLPAYHLLNRDADLGVANFIIVDFRNVYGVNYGFLKAHALTISSRVRLLPPYREHLSQAFARFFMRVGLPTDIAGLQ